MCIPSQSQSQSNPLERRYQSSNPPNISLPLYYPTSSEASLPSSISISPLYLPIPATFCRTHAFHVCTVQSQVFTSAITTHLPSSQNNLGFFEVLHQSASARRPFPGLYTLPDQGENEASLHPMRPRLGAGHFVVRTLKISLQISASMLRSFTSSLAAPHVNSWRKRRNLQFIPPRGSTRIHIQTE
jgi:hypothetical protein